MRRLSLNRYDWPEWLDDAFESLGLFTLHRHYRDVKYWVLHRFIWRSHMFHIRGIEKGQYYDMDTRLFHAMFSMLVDFVLIEKFHRAFSDCPDPVEEPVAWEYKQASWWNRWRNKEAWAERLAFAYLDWEMTLCWPDPAQEGVIPVPTEQAKNAEAVKRLYTWYRHQRPLRIDPYEMDDSTIPHYITDDGEFTENCVGPAIRTSSGRIYGMRKLTPEYKEHLKRAADLETQYYDEDTRNAQELVAIRAGLWT